jgi:hypothetical protein
LVLFGMASWEAHRNVEASADADRDREIGQAGVAFLTREEGNPNRLEIGRMETASRMERIGEWIRRANALTAFRG